MLRNHPKPFLLVAVLLAAVVLAPSVTAQYYWMYPGATKSVSLEVYKPKFDQVDDLGMLNGVAFMSGRFRTSENLSVVFEVPISNYDVDEETPWDQDEMLLGNPYVGLEARTSLSGGSQSTIVRLGIRLPVASDDWEKFPAFLMGMVTTFNRFEAFFPDLLTLSLSAGFHHTLESGVNFTYNVGGVLMVPTDDGGESELWADYNVAFWLPIEKLELGAGFAGRLIATEGDIDFSERTAHQLGFAGNYTLGNLKPGVHFRIPLDDDPVPTLDYVYGFNLTFIIE